jgi:Bacterial Ig-like domain/Purple acid Phosphatase, N-terminal domain/RTX calcium-binding nonapeptide repeat (4 copies)
VHRRVVGPRSALRLCVGLLSLLAFCLHPAAGVAAPQDGPGGPILVISRAANPFSNYYAEILRAEGLNEFTNAGISSVTPSVLAAHDVAILGDGPPLTAAKAQMLDDWVHAGGNLIAMRPDPKLAGLLGLGDTPNTLANGYLKVNTSTAPGAGIVGQTIQFHGTADRYTADAGTQTIATLFSDATTSTPDPAVTLRSVGSNGGQAAAFTYDLARSIVYTRQGNPAWSGDERDSAAGGSELIRSDDLFYGAKPGDVQPDWVNLDKVAIPQADEQQHLLSNLIGQMNQDRKPLPRFWFLPHDDKAAVVMTGDDHGNGGTEGRFHQYEALSPSGCSVADWECVRGTSYIYPDTPTLTDSEAAAFQAEGFEIALHVTTNCTNWTSRSQLESFYSDQLAAFATNYPSLSSPTTNRTHCIAWSDWATQPKVELENGIRLDTNYYYWPPDWVQDRPGMFTGSGMPMRFADLDGSMIDVYQAATQMTDESGQSEPFNINALLDKALGPEGYYGVFTANMHTDNASHPGSDAIVASALSHGVPIVSARQMLQWLDGRNASSFNSLSWDGNHLDFTIDVGAGANGLRAMVPTSSSAGSLTGVERDGSSIPTTTQTIKGVEYAFFDATAGSYEATYAVDDTPPVISNVADAVGTDGTATITWDTDEASDSRVDYGTSPGSLNSSQGSSALVTSHSVHLSGLDPNTTYYYRVTSSDAASNSSTEPPGAQPPRSFTTPSASLTDTTVADFNSGTPGADTYVSETGNGEVMLAPTVGAEFSGGPSLPSGWGSSTWESEGGGAGGSATVAGGALHVNGAYASTDQTFGPGHSLEFAATFNGATFEHAGLSDNFQSAWAIFSTKDTTNQLYARTNFGSGSPTDTLLPGSLVGSQHLYRIEWDTNEVRFYVDGTLVATHSGTFGTTLRATASEFNAGGAELSVDWLHLSPYPSAGTFDSRVLDAGQPVDWGPLGWTADTPSGTGVAISVRTGNTPTPDGSWTGFTPISSSGADVAGNSRYVQYRAQLSTSDAGKTPSLSEVTIGYTAGADTEAPTIVQRSPAPDATDVAVGDNVSVQFSEPMDPSTIDSSSVRLRADGAGSDVPANVTYSGSTATLNPNADLAPGTVYHVTVAGSVEDANGNALGADDTWSFTTQLASLTDTTAPDFSAGTTGADTYVSESGNGEVMLAPTVGEEFSGGPGLPAGWQSQPWNLPAGSATVSGGELVVDGASAGTVQTYGSGRALDFTATFGGANFEHVGFGVDFNNDPDWAMFSIKGDGTFNARTNNGGSQTETALPSSLIGAAHHYRIEWDSTEVRYFVDGSLVATHAADFGTTQMRPLASDLNSGGPDVSVDWLHVSPYSASGTFDSRVLDAGEQVEWDALSWGADTPAGTGVALSVRTGDTPTPDATWSAFSPLASSGDSIGANSRYLQYRAELTSSDPDTTPALSEVSASYATDSTAPDTEITDGPSGITNDPTATFAFSSSEQGSTYSCRVDSNAYGSCTSPRTTARLADGSHTFEVRAKDPSGNVDPSPAARAFEVRTAEIHISGSTLLVRAAPGATDNFSITRPSASVLRVTDLPDGPYDGSDVRAYDGCTRSGPGAANCSAAGIGLIRVFGGDEADQVVNSTAVRSVLNGATADDTLIGGSKGDTLTGAAGADVLRGMDGNDQLLGRDLASDATIDCDGGGAPGAADKADLDKLPLDPSPLGCETVTRH